MGSTHPSPSTRAVGTLAIATALLLGAVGAGCRQAPPRRVEMVQPERTVVYRVAPGDTIDRIAAWHGVPVAEVERWNGLSGDAALAPGRTLVVPYRPLTTYVVKPGDTLGGLANRFGVDVQALGHLNGITDPRRLASGAELRIPHDAQSKEVAGTRPLPKPEEPTGAKVAARKPSAPPTPSPDVAAAKARREADVALATARAAYDDAEFEAALTWADRARMSVPASSDRADRSRLAHAHLMRGMAEVALGRESAARASFGHALELDRDIELDPKDTSPKVISVFREVRGR